MVNESRHNRHSSHQVLQVPLGKHKYNGGTVFYTERFTFGVTIIAANARYGKTITVKNMYTEIGQVRPVIILDYLGEHTLSKFPNFLNEDRNTKCLPDMKEIKGFKFKISQFNKESDWLSLTFADRGALLMTDLARQYNSHLDDPDTFFEMLNDVPESTQFRSNNFKNKYGFELSPVNSATLQSCKTLYGYYHREGFFGKSDDATYHFGKLALQHKYLNINFDLDKASIPKARAIAGKVLEQLKEYIGRFEIPPLIVVEEADVLAPEENDSAYIISSLKILVEFVLKLQKKNIEIMFIVQDLKNLNHSIVGNFHTLILGQLPPGNDYHGVCKQLVWDMDNNYREFLVMRKGVPGYEVFIPHDSCTMY